MTHPSTSRAHCHSIVCQHQVFMSPLSGRSTGFQPCQLCQNNQTGYMTGRNVSIQTTDKPGTGGQWCNCTDWADRDKWCAAYSMHGRMQRFILALQLLHTKSLSDCMHCPSRLGEFKVPVEKRFYNARPKLREQDLPASRGPLSQQLGSSWAKKPE